MKNTNKYYVYDLNVLNQSFLNIIKEKPKNLILNKNKYLKILEKHTRILDSEKFLKKIQKQVPSLINKGFKQNGVWVNWKNNDFIFLIIHEFDNQHCYPICIPLHFNDKNYLLSIKTFYIVNDVEKRINKFNQKYDEHFY